MPFLQEMKSLHISNLWLSVLTRVNVCREEITQSVQHKLSVEKPEEQLPLTCIFAYLIACFVESHVELFRLSC